MKKTVLNIALSAISLLAVLGANSCKNDPAIDGQAEISASPTSLEADASGDELTFSVTCNAYWDITFTDQDGETIRWMTASPTRGQGNGEVTLTVNRNNTASQRVGMVTLTTADGKGTASVSVTQAGSDNPVGGGYSMPIYDVFRKLSETQPANGIISGNAFIFDDGMVIERIGGTPGLTYEGNYNDNDYQMGLYASDWSADTHWLITIPLEEALSGDLRFFYAARTDAFSASSRWTFQWSSDGSSWNTPEQTMMYSGIGRYQMFTVAEDKKIPAGGHLYVKLAPPSALDTDVFFESGVCITEAQPPLSTLPKENDTDIIFSYGFDELNGLGADVTLDMGYMTSMDGGSYSSPFAPGILASSGAYNRPGYVKIGGASSSGYIDILLSRITEMGIAVTDAEVSFSTCLYMPATNVGASQGVCVEIAPADASGASIEGTGISSGMEYGVFKEFKAKVLGATGETKIRITSAGTPDNRFFLDDILVRVTGTPVPIDPDAATLIGISQVREMKPGTGTFTITENNFVRGRVVSDRTGGNLPASLFALADNGNAAANNGIFVKLGGHTFDAGDEIEVTVKGGTLGYEDGLLVLTPAAGKVVKTASANSVPAVRSVTTAEFASGSFEAMYIQVLRSQVIEADLSKNMGNTIGMETVDETNYVMKTLAAATFADQAVPQLSGTVRGIGGAGLVLMPRNMSDVAQMSVDRFGDGPMEKFIPLAYTFDMDNTQANPTMLNAEISGDKLTFTGGASIERLGGNSAMAINWQNQTNFWNCFLNTTGWDAEGAAWLVTVPAGTQDISGAMRFYFSACSNTAAMQTEWKIDWSNNNSDWFEIESMVTGVGVLSMGNEFTLKNTGPNGISMAVFTVPADKKVTPGNNIYFRIYPKVPFEAAQAAGNGRFSIGFYLDDDVVENTKMPTGEKVILTNNFEENTTGVDYMAGSGVRYLANHTMPAYTKEGWTVTSGNLRPGYIFCGGAASEGHGIKTPELSAIGSGTTDLTLTFDACLYMPSSLVAASNAIAVEVTGGGTASEITWATNPEHNYYAWHTGAVTITGASSSTQIEIKASGGSGDRRFFLDDIIIIKQ